VKPAKRFRATPERAAMGTCARWPPCPPTADARPSRTRSTAAGKEAGFEPLRDWFTALYEVLLGQSQGPRFGSFAALFGLPETVALIDQALAREAATA
jgi:lysyl-tRNA synthetase class 1